MRISLSCLLLASLLTMNPDTSPAQEEFSDEGCAADSTYSFPEKLPPDCTTYTELLTYGISFTAWTPETSPMSLDWQFTYSSGSEALGLVIDDLRLAARSFSHPDSTRNSLGYGKSDLGLLYDYFHRSVWDSREFDHPDYQAQYGSRFLFAGESQWEAEVKEPTRVSECCNNFVLQNCGLTEEFWCNYVVPTAPPIEARNHIDVIIRTPDEGVTLRPCGGGRFAYAGQFVVDGFPADLDEFGPSEPGRQHGPNAVTVAAAGVIGANYTPEGAWHTVLAHELVHIIEADGIRAKGIDGELIAQFGKYLVGKGPAVVETPYGASLKDDPQDDWPQNKRYQNYLLWASYLASHFTQGTETLDDDLAHIYLTQHNDDAPVNPSWIPLPDQPRNQGYFKPLADLLEDPVYDDAVAYPYLQDLGPGILGENRLERVFINYGIANFANRPDLGVGEYGYPPPFVATEILPLFEDVNCVFGNAASIPPQFTVGTSEIGNPVLVTSPYSPGDPLAPCPPPAAPDPPISEVDYEVFGWSHDYLIFTADPALADKTCRELNILLEGLAPDFSSNFTNHLSAHAILYGNVGSANVWDSPGSVLDIVELETTTDGSGVTDVTGSIPCFGDFVEHVVIVLTVVEKDMPPTRGQSGSARSWPYQITYSVEETAPVTLLEKDSTAGITTGGTPFGAAPLELDGGGNLDLLVGVYGGRAALFEKGPEIDGVPTFNPRIQTPHFPALTDVDHRGVSLGDYDNDGDLDAFLAHETLPKLYRNDGGNFSDQTDEMGLDVLGADSWSAAWGDYDRDGYLDLYVVRASGDPGASTGGAPTPDWIETQGLEDYLLRNELGSGGQFTKVTVGFDGSTPAGLVTDPTATSSVSWADVDNDGWLDLFVGWLAPPGTGDPSWSILYINQGDGTFDIRSFEPAELASASPPKISDIRYVSGVAWSDFNQDGYLDIAIAKQNTSGQGSSLNALICLNGGASSPGQLTQELDFNKVYEDPMNNVRPIDLNLDGRPDALFAPRDAADQALALVGYGFGEFSGVGNKSIAVGLDAGTAGALTAADFNSDGDSDVYLGRADAESRYFQTLDASSGEAPTSNFVKVRSIASDTGTTWDGGNNFLGIGARVTLRAPSTSAPELVQAQVVDGGSGRGSQASNVLTFGLGDYDTADVTVTWPDGSETTRAIGSGEINNGSTPIDIPDDHLPQLRTSTITAYGQPQPSGKIDWVFTWETDYTADRDQDAVEVRVYDPPKGSPPPQCEFPTTTLTRASTGVVYTYVPKSGGGLVHTIRWANRDCYSPCTMEYRVTSAVGTRTPETSTWNTFSIPVCTQ